MCLAAGFVKGGILPPGLTRPTVPLAETIDLRPERGSSEEHPKVPYAKGKSPNWVTWCIYANIMQQFFENIDAIDDIEEVLWYAVGVSEEQGAVRQSYHFTPLFERQNSERTVVRAHGFDPEWLKCYDESDFRRKDPIPSRTMAHGSLLTWKDAEHIAPNSPANEEFFAAMRRFGLVHGFGLPLFGPRSRNAYASIDFDKPITEVGKKRLGIVRAVSQSAHQRVCVLLEAELDKVELSEREREVLEWIVRGKSLSVIAEILGLSPDTVKTYARRIYAKLGANDRIAAVIKALKLGIVPG